MSEDEASKICDKLEEIADRLYEAGKVSKAQALYDIVYAIEADYGGER